MFRLKLVQTCKCAACGRPRPLPGIGEAEAIMRHENKLGLRADSRCVCGADRLVLSWGVTME